MRHMMRSSILVALAGLFLFSTAALAANLCPLTPNYCCIIANEGFYYYDLTDGYTTLDEAVHAPDAHFGCASGDIRYIWLYGDTDYVLTYDLPANRFISGRSWNNKYWSEVTITGTVTFTDVPGDDDDDDDDNTFSGLTYVTIPEEGLVVVDGDMQNVRIMHVTFEPASVLQVADNPTTVDIRYNLFEYAEGLSATSIVVGGDNVGPSGTYLNAYINHNLFEGFDYTGTPPNCTTQGDIVQKAKVAFYNNIVRDWDNPSGSVGIAVSSLNTYYRTSVYSEENSYEPADNASTPTAGLYTNTSSYSYVNSVNDDVECPSYYPYSCNSGLGCSSSALGIPCYNIIIEHWPGYVFDPEDIVPSFTVEEMDNVYSTIESTAGNQDPD